MITTDQYWDVDGVVLNTRAWNIESLAGLDATPDVRGDNIVVPYRHGAIRRQKWHGSVTRSMALWIRCCDEDGEYPATRELRWGKLNDNKDYLLGVLCGDLANERRITRRLWDSEGVLNSRYFDGDYAGSFQITYSESEYYPELVFVIDFLCADPYWHGTEEETLVGVSGPVTVRSRGTAPAHLNVEVHGPVVNPAVSTPNHAVTFKGTVEAGESLLIDSKALRATVGGKSVRRHLAVATGDRAPLRRTLLGLSPGDNRVTVREGVATLSHSPAFI